MNLTVDLSWYTRYRSGDNPDLGAAFKGPFVIANQPAIPLSDTDTPPTTNPTIPITGRDASRIQAIANTAGFHFAFIEQGGLALIPLWPSSHQTRQSSGSWLVLAESRLTTSASGMIRAETRCLSR
jgi:hypothetical protein